MRSKFIKRGPVLLRLLCLWFLLPLFVGCSSKSSDLPEFPEQASAERDQFYFEQVRPLLNQRCVACHACYTSPCQLNLADYDGIRRGATKTKLYEGSRLKEIEPTRLGIDAASYQEWQQTKGFFPVAQGGEASLFEELIRQRQNNHQPVDDQAKKGWSCPKDNDELAEFLKNHAEKGMPYGLPPLKDEEVAIFSRWLNEGYPTLSPAGRAKVNEISDEEKAEIQTWEALLNDLEPKSRLIARYLYEHLFIADIEFSNAPAHYFRLVRSSTHAPDAVYPVKTRRPYDEAGIFYYRFQKVTQVVTHKNHMIYTLSPERMKRLRELFYDSKWTIRADEYPSYDPEVAANPFLVYQNMPVESRYRFLLDSALFFVSAFIKGTVCEGETAVNVVDEKFFIFFTDPSNRMAGVNNAFTAQSAKELAIPSRSGIFDSFYIAYKREQMKFVDARRKIYDAFYPLGLSLFDVWDGDARNPQAVLTVFRHDDNSYVQSGAIGEVPKTAWVMDYTIFERMYYLLSAGFDVFGNLGHQVSTRLYMDNLRVESEDLFLSFLPAESREPLRKSWYRGQWARRKMDLLNPYAGVTSSPRMKFLSKDPKREFIEKILSKRFTPEVRGKATLEACCGTVDNAVTRELRKLTAARGGFIKTLPDIAFLYVEHEGRRADLYSLIRHRSHTNIAFMFTEEDRLVPDEDTITIQNGVMGSFPNFFIHVKDKDIAEFVQATGGLDVSNASTFKAWVRAYGVSRNRQDFWQYFDTIQKWFDEDQGTRGGILDLSKYELW